MNQLQPQLLTFQHAGSMRGRLCYAHFSCLLLVWAPTEDTPWPPSPMTLYMADATIQSENHVFFCTEIQLLRSPRPPAPTMFVFVIFVGCVVRFTNMPAILMGRVQTRTDACLLTRRLRGGSGSSF